MDALPDDHDRAGALSRDLPCPGCAHDHSSLPCDHCPCGIALRNGIDF